LGGNPITGAGAARALGRRRGVRNQKCSELVLFEDAAVLPRFVLSVRRE
jgi:hypothetical protein